MTNVFAAPVQLLATLTHHWSRPPDGCTGIPPIRTGLRFALDSRADVPLSQGAMLSPDLPFPFWLLIGRDSSPWRPVVLAPGHATGFSTHQQAGEFLARADNPSWEVRLIARSTLAALLDDFEGQGLTGLALGGTRIPFHLEESG
jgi:hypothetical protein